MPRPLKYQSVSTIIEEAVSGVVARLSRNIEDAIAQASRASASTAPARTQRPGLRVSVRRSRRRGVDMTRWVADRNARRVPKFVIEVTGLDTKKKIVAKYGENAAFEKDKPLPKPVTGAPRSIRAGGKEAARTVQARPPIVRKASTAAK